MNKDAIMSAADEPWLTAQEGADYVRIKHRTILLWARQGKVPGYVLSGTKRRVWRFRKSDLDTILLARDGRMICSTSPSVLTKGAE